MQIQRKSYSEIDRTYFFTATIHQWLPLLLSSKENKELIVNYLKELPARDLIKVYSFVIMPNHVHFIWQQLQKNEKETPQASFLKYTAHEFLKTLKQNGTSKPYAITATNTKHEIWQRDSLGIEISSIDFEQKIDYIHFNSVSGKWNLAKDYLDYYYSSARFYETGMDEFGFLNNLFHGERGMFRVPRTMAQGIYFIRKGLKRRCRISAMPNIPEGVGKISLP